MSEPDDAARWRDEAWKLAGAANAACAYGGGISPADLYRIGIFLQDAEPPGAYRRGIRGGEAQERARVAAMTALHVSSLSPEQFAELRAVRQTEPAGLLLVADDPRAGLGRAVIEAARAWFAADIGTDAQAGDRLSAVVRAYEAAIGAEQRENADGD